MKELRNKGRRAFLRGLGGTAIALPLLEFTHEKVWAQTGVAKRFVTMFAHGGVITNQAANDIHSGNGDESGTNLWKPADPGETLVLGTIHQPLQDYVDKLLVVRGIDNYATRMQAQYGTGEHGLNNSLALTVSDVQGDESAGGPSIDFVVAEELGRANPTTFNRIHLWVNAHAYGSPYFISAGNRVNGEGDPQTAFDTIFSGVTASGAPSPEQVHLHATRRSILEGVINSFNEAKPVVGKRDLMTIEAHLDHLHELEAELQAPAVQCEPPTDDFSGADTERTAHLHVKIILAALRCGLTNVANLEMGDVITPWTPTGHIMTQASIGHALHKMQRSMGATGADRNRYDDWLAEVTDNHQWRMSIFEELLAGLDDPQFAEGDMTMLDNSIALYTSEFSEGANHCGSNMPFLLAGSAGGQWRTGRHLNFMDTSSGYRTDHSAHNLFTSILQACGSSANHFGNDDAVYEGPLPDLI
jgi:hypothetical protein